ncbi:MAG: dTDP-4-dehydrorhamnose reductase [Acidimicrobiales bacterium]
MTRPVRILVTGAGGQVGLDLLDTLRGVTPLGGDPSFQPDEKPVGDDEFEVLGLTRHDLDITNHDHTIHAVRSVRPDVIIHLAAYTQVDRAEVDRDACYAVNAGGTETLSLAAHDVDAHLIAISTDYVFDGTKGAGYVEDDPTNPLNVYGASKRAGELLCANDNTIVRTSWVMGVRGKNVLHVIGDRATSGATVRFVNDQTGTATFASDLARALVTMARQRPSGIWHVANAGTTTWFDIAAYAGSLLGRDEDFATPIATSELSPAPLAVRPVRSDLSTEKWVDAGFARLPDWRDGVARLLHARVSMP